MVYASTCLSKKIKHNAMLAPWTVQIWVIRIQFTLLHVLCLNLSACFQERNNHFRITKKKQGEQEYKTATGLFLR